MLKLDIGGGRNKRDHDYVAVDLYGAPDVFGEMDCLPFADDTVDLIWSSHTLEHIPMARVPGALKEWLRVLKPGAKAIISVPNFDYVAKYWLTGPNRLWAEQLVFGLQVNDGEFHRCAFTAPLLKGDLEGCGFEVLRVEYRWSYDQETLQATARKPLAKTVPAEHVQLKGI